MARGSAVESRHGKLVGKHAQFLKVQVRYFSTVLIQNYREIKKWKEDIIKIETTPQLYLESTTQHSTFNTFVTLWWWWSNLERSVEISFR